MGFLADRTCTEIRSDGAGLGESKPLSGFRSQAAVVLLGEPGAGKTTEFKRECEVWGESAKYIRARDFVTLDVDSRPEWQDVPLFIDGLDEIRAGARDARASLDSIRHRLDRLRPPAFRISCREADWLGRNDRESLTAVAPRGTEIVTVRLDPLNEESIKAILESKRTGGIEGFIKEARRRGIWPLLENPLTLELLVKATQQGAAWPKSRRETFEMAIGTLAREQNDEHLSDTQRFSLAEVLEAAGFLSAVQLLAGLEGLSAERWLRTSLFPPFDRIGRSSIIKQALGTKLFRAEGEGAFRPMHRQVAEFIGGRYLAKLIEEGLPVRRATALMTSPLDGGVVTSLRGLSAWLTAHCQEAREILVNADPVGVGLYGDISDFTEEDKKNLIESLARFASRGFLGVAEHFGFTETAWAFRSLAAAEMTTAIDDRITKEGYSSRGDRTVEFLCRVLSQADRDMESLASLVPNLVAILWDGKRSSRVKRSALDAYLHIAPLGEDKRLELRKLLQGIQDKRVDDPDDELRGTLLDVFYPDELSPADVWEYVSPRNQHFYGRFSMFWDSLAKESSIQQITELLDVLHRDYSKITSLLQDYPSVGLPVRLLVRALDLDGEQIDTRRLYNWLTATTLPGEWANTQREDDKVREWLENHPNVQKEIVLTWLEMNHAESSPSSRWHFYRAILRRSRLPADFESWCLDKAIDLFAAKPHLSRSLLMEACNARESEGLTIEVMRDKLRGEQGLVRELDRIHHHRTSMRLPERKGDKELKQLRERRRQEEHRRRKEWTTHLRSEEKALRDNTFTPRNLHVLSVAFFDGLKGGGRSWSRDSLEDLTGGDPHLMAVVVTALESALWREDVPDVKDTIEFHSQSRRPWLAYPVLASMQLVQGRPELQEQVSDSQKRRALAIYFCYPLAQEGPRQCHDEWFGCDPALVLDVLYGCASAAIRRGDPSPPGIYDVSHISDHEDLVYQTVLRLLGAFPPRAPKRQLREFDRLLKKTLLHYDTVPLKHLATKKLALKSLNVGYRIRWMTVVTMLCEGRGIDELKDFVLANERRVRHLAEFLAHLFGFPARHADLPGFRNPEFLVSLIQVLGASYGPQDLNGIGAVTIEVEASEAIAHIITLLSSIADLNAKNGLDELVGDPQFSSWNTRLEWAQERQRILYRDTSYRHPDTEQVLQTLANRAPANAADLFALLCDHLASYSEQVRGDNANLWRQFWNEDSYGRPTGGKPENSCRDVLLADLKRRLPSGVDAMPEGCYAADKRADIRTFFGGFNIPMEIKKSCHRDLWSALRNQLIGQYATDPETSGYGIFLVLWFGPTKTPRPPKGKPPATPEELRKKLENDLTPNESRKIAVAVVDVTKPSNPSTWSTPGAIDHLRIRASVKNGGVPAVGTGTPPLYE